MPTSEPAIPEQPAAISQQTPAIDLRGILDRPLEQRLREYQYRFAQACVFGLPVIVLQYVGPSLGGAESERWVGMLQALLAGWVMYVAVAGLAFEGFLLLARGRITAGFVISLTTLGLYLWSIISVLHILWTGALWWKPLLFHVCIFIVIGWSAIGWRRLSHQLNRS